MANVQVEDGYTRIANSLYEALIRARLPARHQRVCHAIIRKTYGFGKTEDKISLSQLVAITGIKKSHLSLLVNELVALNVLTKSDLRPGLTPVLGIQKDFDLWRGRAEVSPQEGTVPTSLDSSPRGGQFPERGTVPSEGKGTVPREGDGGVPSQGTTKETLKETSKEKSTSHFSEEDSGSSKPAKVRMPSDAAQHLTCEFLRAKGEAFPDAKPTTQSAYRGWEDAMDKILRIDGERCADRTSENVTNLVSWLFRSEAKNAQFWKGVVLSVPKLREKWDQLMAAKAEDNKRPAAKGSPPKGPHKPTTAAEEEYKPEERPAVSQSEAMQTLDEILEEIQQLNGEYIPPATKTRHRIALNLALRDLEFVGMPIIKALQGRIDGAREKVGE